MEAEMPPRVKVGDVFEIPLSDGKKAYGQFVYDDKQMGPLVRVFDLTTHDVIDVDGLMCKLQEAGVLLGPLFTGVYAAIRTGLWRVIGHLPVKGFVYPGFLMVFYEGERVLGPWRLWNGEKEIVLGRRLPDEYKNREMLAVWAPSDVAERIETGENPYRRIIQEG